MAKLVAWFRNTFYTQWRESQDAVLAQLEHERIFTVAMVEFMLRQDYPRHQILEVMRKGRTPEEQVKIDKEMCALNDGQLPPDCVECPVIDFPTTR